MERRETPQKLRLLSPGPGLEIARALSRTELEFKLSNALNKA